MKLRDFINQYILFGGVRLSKGTSDGELAEFFSLVHPVKTEHQLVRIGGPNDGGYLVPDDFKGIKVCFSPGVAASAHFEEALANRGIKSFLADYSVECPPIKNPFFFFEKKFLGTKNNEMYTTLASWIDRNAPQEEEMILQMDIEGAEYSVILSTPEEIMRKFRIIVIEFHNLEQLAERSGFQLVNLTFSKLLSDFDIVHIHPNNCTQTLRYRYYDLPPVMEFTFLRKNRVSLRLAVTDFPHPLDCANLTSRKDHVLPRCWRGKSR
jgi:hypothetical protein